MMISYQVHRVMCLCVVVMMMMMICAEVKECRRRLWWRWRPIKTETPWQRLAKKRRKRQGVDSQCGSRRLRCVLDSQHGGGESLGRSSGTTLNHQGPTRAVETTGYGEKDDDCGSPSLSLGKTAQVAFRLGVVARCKKAQGCLSLLPQQPTSSSRPTTEWRAKVLGIAADCRGGSRNSSILQPDEDGIMPPPHKARMTPCRKRRERCAQRALLCFALLPWSR